VAARPAGAAAASERRRSAEANERPAPFEDLLSHELADAERYRQAEETLEQLRREWVGEFGKKVVPIKRTNRKNGR
jgi:hypothetical protein